MESDKEPSSGHIFCDALKVAINASASYHFRALRSSRLHCVHSMLPTRVPRGTQFQTVRHFRAQQNTPDACVQYDVKKDTMSNRLTGVMPVIFAAQCSAR